MLYRKFHADQLFTGRELLDNSHVLIASESGVVHDIVQVDAAGDAEHFDGILSPGFINSHCHLELSHMKGLIPEHTGLVDFVFKIVSQRHFPEDEVLAAIDAAEHEMLGNGIVAVGDICNNVMTLLQKKKGRLYYHNFIEASGWLPTAAESRLQKAQQIFHDFERADGGIRGNNSIVPHAAYSVSPVLWKALVGTFNGRITTIHNQETAGEDDFFTSGKGDLLRMYELMKIDNSFHKPSRKSSLQSYFHHLNVASSVLLVHNTFTSPADIRYAMMRSAECRQKLSWCICINANQYIEDRLPPVQELRRQGAAIVLGTDSLASNHNLDLLDEMRTIQGNFDIPLNEMLRWATFNGACALEIGDRFGSFEKKRTPGIIHISNIEHGKITSLSKASRIL